MDKPTQEQIREFWDKLGIKKQRRYIAVPKDSWDGPPGIRLQYPDIDLNNLFKYAVPLVIKRLTDIDLSTEKEAMYKLFGLWIEKFWSQTMSIEDALFWAIWEMIERTNQSSP